MDQNVALVDEQKKNDVQRMLVESILNASERGDIEYLDMKEAATYIVDNISKVTSQPELDIFLQDITAQWPIFKNILVLGNEQNIKMREQQVIDKLSSYIKNLSH